MTNLLPSFLVISEYTPNVFTIKKANLEDKYILEEHPHILFSYPSDAYDYAIKILGGEVIFDSNDLTDMGTCLGGMFIEERNSNDCARVLFSYNAHGKQKSLENNYAYFLELNEEYLANPNDWGNAYRWVQNHPAFYHRNIDFPDYWIMDDGWDTVYVYVDKLEDGSSKVFLEHGQWLPSSNGKGEEYCHTVSSHDYRLDVVASNFEEAYVAFAKKVYELYDITGEERN